MSSKSDRHPTLVRKSTIHKAGKTKAKSSEQVPRQSPKDEQKASSMLPSIHLSSTPHHASPRSSRLHTFVSPAQLIQTKLSSVILELSARFKWEEEATMVAINYVNYLCTGNGSFAELLPELQRHHQLRLKQIVEERFATTTFFLKEKMGGAILPGMMTKTYEKYVKRAAARFGSSTRLS